MKIKFQCKACDKHDTPCELIIEADLDNFTVPDHCPWWNTSDWKQVPFTDLVPIYQQAVNEIDDFLEYRWKSFPKSMLRKEILGMIEGITDKLKPKEELCPHCNARWEGEFDDDKKVCWACNNHWGRK
jgi:hypothetical protein